MSEPEFIGCTIKQLPPDQTPDAAARAIEHNPANRPPLFRIIETAETVTSALCSLFPAPLPPIPSVNVPAHLAVLTTKYWGAGGVKLTVGFPFDSTPDDLKRRILSHMNAWRTVARANVEFVLTNTDPQVRIARGGSGYWSYLGTDILSIPRNQPTMNLQGFTMATPEREFTRVVRHEAGHTLGYPHEHMRKQLVERIDREKAILYFQQTQGWSAQVTQQQVLTPLNEASIRGTPNADQDSIMAYSLPGSITIDGLPINGGSDIDAEDAAFAAKLYPLVQVPQPPPPVTTKTRVTLLVGSGLAQIEKVEQV